MKSLLISALLGQYLSQPLQGFGKPTIDMPPPFPELDTSKTCARDLKFNYLEEKSQFAGYIAEAKQVLVQIEDLQTAIMEKMYNGANNVMHTGIYFGYKNVPNQGALFGQGFMSKPFGEVGPFGLPMQKYPQPIGASGEGGPFGMFASSQESGESSGESGEAASGEAASGESMLSRSQSGEFGNTASAMAASGESGCNCPVPFCPQPKGQPMYAPFGQPMYAQPFPQPMSAKPQGQPMFEPFGQPSSAKPQGQPMYAPMYPPQPQGPPMNGQPNNGQPMPEPLSEEALQRQQLIDLDLELCIGDEFSNQCQYTCAQAAYYRSPQTMLKQLSEYRNSIQDQADEMGIFKTSTPAKAPASNLALPAAGGR